MKAWQNTNLEETTVFSRFFAGLENAKPSREGDEMISREKIEKRIKEEYDELVFQGYTFEEIAYMGTCLQKWAIERGLGIPDDLKNPK
ncbi:hypothetical protein METP3_03042 [Methanosarcinales archaeon]|nr:hypothetical protein METP3_03042 [Methanosarcinales archaeon]